MAVRVYLSDGFQAKKAKLIQGGKEQLQVIADFDRTITRFMFNGQRGATCHGVIEHSPFLGEEFSEKTHELFRKYYPIEISDCPIEEKTKAMIEWWSKAHEYMIEYGLTKGQILDMIKVANIEVREKGVELFKYLSDEEIPLLIFSAGIADVLETFLHYKNLYHQNVHVISNRMVFADDGKLVGFKGEIIHSLNKNANFLKGIGSDWAHDETRKHIILIGDNLSDIHMSDGLTYSEILSIGFLNDKIEERLESYRQTFDVVITNDGPFDFIFDLIKEIVQ